MLDRANGDILSEWQEPKNPLLLRNNEAFAEDHLIPIEQTEGRFATVISSACLPRTSPTTREQVSGSCHPATVFPAGRLLLSRREAQQN
jgi:hypothetical protein